MSDAQHRQDMSDEVWALLEPHLPGQAGQWGGIAKDNRQFINGVFWILQTNATWRDLPSDYGKWETVNQRFKRWRDKGIWEKVLEKLIDEPDYEWLIINKVHPRAPKTKEGRQNIERSKGNSIPKYTWPWMRMICQSEVLLHKLPQQIVRKLST